MLNDTFVTIERKSLKLTIRFYTLTLSSSLLPSSPAAFIIIIIIMVIVRRRGCGYGRAAHDDAAVVAAKGSSTIRLRLLPTPPSSSVPSLEELQAFAIQFYRAATRLSSSTKTTTTKKAHGGSCDYIHTKLVVCCMSLTKPSRKEVVLILGANDEEQARGIVQAIQEHEHKKSCNKKDASLKAAATRTATTSVTTNKKDITTLKMQFCHSNSHSGEQTKTNVEAKACSGSTRTRFDAPPTKRQPTTKDNAKMTTLPSPMLKSFGNIGMAAGTSRTEAPPPPTTMVQPPHTTIYCPPNMATALTFLETFYGQCRNNSTPIVRMMASPV